MQSNLPNGFLPSPALDTVVRRLEQALDEHDHARGDIRSIANFLEFAGRLDGLRPPARQLAARSSPTRAVYCARTERARRFLAAAYLARARVRPSEVDLARRYDAAAAALRNAEVALRCAERNG